MYDKFKRKINPGDYVLYLKGLGFNTFNPHFLLKNLNENCYLDIYNNTVELKNSQFDLYDSNVYKINLSDDMLLEYKNNLGNAISNSYRLENITDCFNRKIKIGDFVLYSTYRRDILRYGIVYSSNLVYTEYGF